MNSSGAATAINTYDEYGQRGGSNTGRFQYTGQPWLPEVSLYHYRARAYSPTLGRFMQTDPILHQGGMNLYAYVGNDPTNMSDPFGLCGSGVDYWLVTTTYRDGTSSSYIDIRPRFTHCRWEDWFGGNPAIGGRVRGDPGNVQEPFGAGLPVREYCESRGGADSPDTGYLDLGGGAPVARIFGIPLGITAGVMMDLPTGDLYAYVGGGVITSAGATFTYSDNSRPSTGANVGMQGFLSVLGPLGPSGQLGYSWGQGERDARRGGFREGGIGLGQTGVSATGFYSWKIGNICEGRP